MKVLKKFFKTEICVLFTKMYRQNKARSRKYQGLRSMDGGEASPKKSQVWEKDWSQQV